MSFAALRAQRDARHAPLRRARLTAPASSEAPRCDTDAGEPRVDGSEPAQPAEPPTETAAQARAETPAEPLVKEDVAMAPPPEEAQATTADPSDAALFPELADTPLEVRRSPQHGRGLYAAKAVKAGTFPPLA